MTTKRQIQGRKKAKQTRARNRLNAMPERERMAWLARGPVTVAEMGQLKDGNFVRDFAVKVRGKFLASSGTLFRFPTKDEARAYGNAYVAELRAILATQPSDSLNSEEKR